MNEIISVKGLRKIYHTPKQEIFAVDNFSFRVFDGDFISIVGPSGCGKSTILSILVGIEEKSGGKIEIANDIKIGYMPQDDALFEWLNVLDNCLLPLKIKHVLTKERKEYVIKLLKKYGLGSFLNSYPQNLSGGMRQRVSLIRTLATNPDVIFVDEPFSALDYQSRLILSDDVYRIIKNEGKSAVMVTHSIEEAVTMSDTVIVLSKRPCTIKKIIQIKRKENKLPTENRKDENYGYYYDMIWKELDLHD